MGIAEAILALVVVAFIGNQQLKIQEKDKELEKMRKTEAIIPNIPDTEMQQCKDMCSSGMVKNFKQGALLCGCGEISE